MTKKWYLLLFWAFFIQVGNTYTQDCNADSLLIFSNKGLLTNQIKSLLKLARCLEIPTEKRLEFERMAIDKSNLITSKPGLAAVHLEFGKYYYNVAKYNEGLLNLKKYLYESEDSDSISNINYANLLVGQVYSKLGMYYNAVEFLQKAASYAESQKDTAQLIQLYRYLGYAYHNIDTLDKAEKYYSLALGITKENPRQKKNHIKTFHEIVDFYQKTSQHQKAIVHLLSFLQSTEAHKNISEVVWTHSGLAKSFGALQDIPNAKHHFTQSILTYKDHLLPSGNLQDTYFSLLNIYFAEYLLSLGDEESLREANTLCLQSQNTIPATEYGLSLYVKSMLSKIYRHLGHSLQAKKYLKEAQSHFIAAKINNEFYSPTAINWIRLLQTEAIHLGEKNLALQAKEMYESAIDSINLRERGNLMIVAQNRQDVIRQEKLNEVLLIKNTNKSRLNLLFSGLLGITLLFSTFVMISLNKNRQLNRILQGKNNELENRNIEIADQAKRILANNQEILNQKIDLEKLNDFKEFTLGTIIHDLKTPLNAIILQSHEAETRKAGQKMLRLVHNLLDIQKLEEAKMPIHYNIIDAKSLIERSLDEVDLLLQDKGLILDILQEHEIIFEGDFDLLERSLTNLLTNAIKFSPAGATITISAKTSGNSVLISVADQGPGIAKEKQSLLFQKYSQIESRNSGKTKSTGLGLTFCKLAVEALHGKLELTSQEGQGAVFTMILPIPHHLNSSNLNFTVTVNSGAPCDSCQKENEKKFAIKLSTRTKEFLTPYLDNLKQFEIFEISEILEYIEQIPNHYEEVKPWKTALTQAVQTFNKNSYNKLLQLEQIS